MLSEVEVLGPSDLDIEVEEISSDVGDVNDGYEEVRRQDNMLCFGFYAVLITK